MNMEVGYLTGKKTTTRLPPWHINYVFYLINLFHFIPQIKKEEENSRTVNTED